MWWHGGAGLTSDHGLAKLSISEVGGGPFKHRKPKLFESAGSALIPVNAGGGSCFPE